MNDIKTLVNRFLTWPLPKTVCADPCASNPEYQHRSGTNLLNAAEAEAMLRHVLEQDVSLIDEGKTKQDSEPVALDEYDAGLLNDWGGGKVEWWQDYIRAELGRAHDFYQSQVNYLAAPQPQPLTVPQGWKLVPVEPTEAMIRAAANLDFLTFVEDAPTYADTYKAMLAAAPEAPAVQPLTDEQIETLRKQTFSTNNPYCPVDSKSMRKAARAIEAAHGIKE